MDGRWVSLPGPCRLWCWEIRLPLLALTPGDATDATPEPGVTVVPEDEATCVRCEVVEGEGVPPIERYREMAEVTASVLAPYGVPVTLGKPVVANASELAGSDIPVPAFDDLLSSAGVRQSHSLAGFVSVWRRIAALNDGAPERIAARALRWSDLAASDGRPVEGFVFGWVALNALYGRCKGTDPSERRALERWLSSPLASDAFPWLCRAQWPSVEHWLGRLAERDWRLEVRGGKQQLLVGSELADTLAKARSGGGATAGESALADLGVKAFLVMYALRNVVVHGDVPPEVGGWVRTGHHVADLELDVDLSSGTSVPARASTSSGQETLSTLSDCAGNLVRPVVRFVLQRLLMSRA